MGSRRRLQVLRAGPRCYPSRGSRFRPPFCGGAKLPLDAIAGWRGWHDPCRRDAGLGDFWGCSVYYVGELIWEVRPLGRHWPVDDAPSDGG